MGQALWRAGWFGVLAGCVSPPSPADVTVSYGTPSYGYLQHAVALPDRGPGYVRARPSEDTRWGTPTLVGALARATASVAATLPGGSPMRIGDLSRRDGGLHERHGSHRAGRDADVIFHLTDSLGRADRGRGWLGFDRFGFAPEDHPPGGTQGTGALFFFDTARNWQFVRTLLLDPDANVLWIFCANGIKARLLRHGVANETNPEALLRAATVLHQPSYGNPHRDHFHVRVACTRTERAMGCLERDPLWPWIRDATELPPFSAILPADDASLLKALLDDHDRAP